MLKYAKAEGTYERIMQDREDRGELPSETLYFVGISKAQQVYCNQG